MEDSNLTATVLKWLWANKILGVIIILVILKFTGLSKPISKWLKKQGSEHFTPSGKRKARAAKIRDLKTLAEEKRLQAEANGDTTIAEDVTLAVPTQQADMPTVKNLSFRRIGFRVLLAVSLLVQLVFAPSFIPKFSMPALPAWAEESLKTIRGVGSDVRDSWQVELAKAVEAGEVSLDSAAVYLERAENAARDEDLYEIFRPKNVPAEINKPKVNKPKVNGGVLRTTPLPEKPRAQQQKAKWTMMTAVPSTGGSYKVTGPIQGVEWGLGYNEQGAGPESNTAPVHSSRRIEIPAEWTYGKTVYIWLFTQHDNKVVKQ